MGKNVVLGSVLALVLVVAAGCGGGEDQKAEDAPSEAAASSSPGQDDQKAGAEPDLDGVPEVVAEVNGEEISRDQFAQVYGAQLQQAVAQAQGQPVDQDELKKRVADDLVSIELLVQEAERREITVSDRDVDKTLEDVAAQNGLQSTDQLLAAMKQQGMDRDAVDDQVRTQVKIERLVEDESGGVRASAKEVRALYEQLAAQQEASGQQGGQKVPPLAQVRPQLEQQVTSQKEAQVAQRLLGQLRKDAEIVINL